MRKATGDERDEALFFDGMERRLPAGLSRDDEPLYLNLEFLDGTRGAHVNISGISGVATKTTYATFLLYSLFHSGVLGAEAATPRRSSSTSRARTSCSSTTPTPQLDERQPPATAPSGCQPGAFSTVAVFAPPRRATPTPRPTSPAAPRASRRSSGRSRSSAAQRLLPFLFADAEDDRQQYTMVVHNVAARLERGACRPATAA